MRKSKLQETLTKEMLEYHYTLHRSMQKVADKLNVSVDSVYKYMKIHNITYAPHYQGIYTCDHDFFSREDEQAFYVAGFIAADGSLQNRKYSKILKITLSKKDRSHLEKIKRTLNSDNPITNYLVKKTKLVKTSNMCSELQIVSSNMYTDLLRYNIIPNKTFVYEMPDWLISHPYVNHFLRGYVDGDGTFTHCGLGKGRSVIQMSFGILGTEQFMYQCRSLLVENCSLNAVKIVRDKNIYRLGYSGNNNVTRISNFLYRDATIFLERKYDRVKHLLNK